MILYIDSTNNQQLKLRIGEIEQIFETDSPRDQDILNSIDQLLTNHQLSVKDITAIEVVTGPGAFTSLRVGISIANALAYALQIPINHQPAGSTIIPEYGKPASITIANSASQR